MTHSELMSQQEEKRNQLYRLLGRLPSLPNGVNATLVYEEERESYTLEKLMLDLNGIERVPAYFLRTKKAVGKAPVILYNHWHGGQYEIGKEEILSGHQGLQDPAYGNVLTDMGFSVMCIDTWAFGERATRTESAIFKEMLWRGQVMWGMMVYDNIRALDYLCLRPDVDSERIGTMGISMGSTMSYWHAALDRRIKAVIDICCLTDFQSLIEENGLDLHGIYYFVPDLLNHFTAAEINALIAPRPHLSLAGNHDKLTPVGGLQKINEELEAAYRAFSAEDAWKLLRYDVGHMETADMRQEIIQFWRKWL
ncbi:dienelactone hydrolase family protein [Paenibacillus solisilvae]|uniref:Dienelactone hydrolase family protein n=1 Tax=Paenibacillus solisilvae TaxID=2486751 RepID=A0ABW0W260_9BACL